MKIPCGIDQIFLPLRFSAFKAPSLATINNQKLLSIFSWLHKLVDFICLLIMGDLNFLAINWAENYCGGSDCSVAFSFFDAVQDSFLVQHVASSTRHRQGQNYSLLYTLFRLYR